MSWSLLNEGEDVLFTRSSTSSSTSPVSSFSPTMAPILRDGTLCICTPGAAGRLRSISNTLALKLSQRSPATPNGPLIMRGGDLLDRLEVFWWVVVILIVRQHLQLISRTVVLHTAGVSAMSPRAKGRSTRVVYLLLVVRQVFRQISTAHDGSLVSPRPRDILPVKR